jgi:hypothetical protein
LKSRAQVAEAPPARNAAAELIGTETKTRRYALTYVDSVGVIERQRFVEVGRRAAQWADLLRRHGLQPAGRVVVLSGRDRHWRTALVGVLEAGGVAVPCAASTPLAEIAALAAETRAVAVASTLPRPDLADAGVTVLCDDDLDSRQGRRWNHFEQTSPHDFALILSGHDGSRLHGAAYTHEALLEQASSSADQLGVREGERLWCTAPDAAVSSLWLLFAAWHRGIELVTVEDQLAPRTKLGLLDKVRPAALWFSDDEYAELAATKVAAWADLGSIRHAITTGEPGKGALAFQAAFGVTAAAAPVEMEAVVIAAPAPSQPAAEAAERSNVGQPAPPNGAAAPPRHLRLLPPRREEVIVRPQDEPTAAEARRRAMQAAARAEARQRAEEAKRQEEERHRAEQEALRREAEEAKERWREARRRVEEETRQRKLAEKAAREAAQAEERRRAEEEKAAAEERQRAEHAARAAERRRAAEAEEQRRREERQAREREKAEKRRLEEEARQRKLAEKAAREAAQAEKRRRAEEEKARARAEKAAAEERRRAEEAARADERRRAEEARRVEEERVRREKEAQREAEEREKEERRRLEAEAKERERAARAAAIERRRRAEQAERIRQAAALVQARRRLQADRTHARPRPDAEADDHREGLAPEVISRISEYTAGTPLVERDGRAAADGSNAKS